MTDRREFIKTTAALSALPLTGRAAFAADGRRLHFDAVIYDSRHVPAGEFGTGAAAAGAPIRAIEGDVTGLWQRELLRRWRSSPAALAGLTERPALFLLERLGWDHRLAVVFQAEHELVAGGRARHRVVRSADPELAATLESAGSAWPFALADALIAGARVPTRNFRPTDTALAAHHDEAAKLYSWIIAPRTAA